MVPRRLVFVGGGQDQEVQTLNAGQWGTLRAHQVPQSMSWAPSFRLLDGASFCKETISNEVSPQILARSVQNRAENLVDGGVRRH